MSNREIGRQLNVNEASVRRGLKDYIPKESEHQRIVVTITGSGLEAPIRFPVGKQ